MPKTNHILFTPVHGLIIDKSINSEINQGRVTFINSAKIPRVRARLKLKNSVAFYQKSVGHKLLENSQVYAYIQSKREKGSTDYSKEMRQIRDAFWILASSFHCTSDRSRAALSLRPTSFGGKHDLTVFDQASNTFNAHLGIGSGPYTRNLADLSWKQSLKYSHYPDLIKILKGKIQVKGTWKSSLVRAAILAGQSYLARHAAEAFSNNMIAIETLLTKRGDKFPDALIDRLVALFGWMTAENPAPWKEKIDRLYSLRCSYVHDGQAGDIQEEDLFEADNILKNLLLNLCKITKHITCKEDLIKLAEELAARQVLGMKPKRKAIIRYVGRSSKTLKKNKSNDMSSWSW